MWYVNHEPNPGGAYSAPQSNEFPGSAKMTNEQANVLIEYNGFVVLTIEDDIVIDIVPNVEAWESWKKALSEDTEEPLADPIADLQAENATLKAQVAALTQSTQFLEDCLVEMAETVYA